MIGVAAVTTKPAWMVYVLVVKGLIWILAGIGQYRAARRDDRATATASGMVTNTRSDENEYIATIEYRDGQGRNRRLTWHCTKEPHLGQTVALRPSTVQPEEMEVAEPAHSVGGAVFCLMVGAACLLIAGFIGTRLVE